MKFYMPVRVYDEPDCVSSHAKEIRALGTKPLIVTGRSSARKSGALDDIAAAVGEYVLFDEVEENPSVETILKGAEKGLKEGCDYVIGIGGGSPLDAAKAIGYLMKKNSLHAADLYDASLKTECLPLAAVPTTCGTGSEVTGVSVLTVHEKKTKISIPHRIFPDLALLDGKYLKSAPLSMIVNTSADAFAHLTESYLSVKADDYSRAIALEGLKIWADCREILKGKEAVDARLLTASCFAGMAIAQTGTSIPHALSYILTYDLHMPHGKAAAYFLPRFLKEARQDDQDAIFAAAGFENAFACEAFFRNVLEPEEVPAETLHRAYDSLLANKVRMASCRFEVDEEVLGRIVWGE